MRSVWVISWKHKILTINRPFFHRALKGVSSFEPFLGLALPAPPRSQILTWSPQTRKSRRFTLSRLTPALNRGRAGDPSRSAPDWRVPRLDRPCPLPPSLYLLTCTTNTLSIRQYHISAACLVVCLDLFQTGHPSTPESDVHRAEVNAAVAILRRTSIASDISARGVELISKLLADDARGRELSSSVASPDRGVKRARVDDGHAQGGWDSHPFGDPQMGFWAPGPEDGAGGDQMLSSLYLMGRRDELDPYAYVPGGGSQGAGQSYGYEGDMWAYGQNSQQQQPPQQLQANYRGDR